MKCVYVLRKSLWSSGSFSRSFFSNLILSFERIVYACITNGSLQLNGGTSFREWDEKENLCVPKPNNSLIKANGRVSLRTSYFYFSFLLFYLIEENQRKKIFISFFYGHTVDCVKFKAASSNCVKSNDLGLLKGIKRLFQHSYTYSCLRFFLVL